MSDDAVIRIEGLWKRYGLPIVPALRRGWRALRGRGPSDEDAWALRDVNLEVRRGETLGIIGRNGAGKSTLLKVLAGVTPPTRGRVAVRGRIFPMIELNAGVHPELTGRENVHLLGAVMGLSRREVRAKLPEIEDFCELGEWFDKPVRMYSSGMLARLGFGVAMNVDADILLIDEVLAVGDLNFQRKCIERIARLQGSNATVLLVTHAIRQAQRVCGQGVLLSGGEIVAHTDMRDIAARYYRDSVREELRRVDGKTHPVVYFDSGEITFTAMELVDSSGNVTRSFRTGEPMMIRIAYSLRKPLKDVVFHLGFVTSDMLRVAVFNSIDERFPPACETHGTVECSIEKLPLMPGVFGLVLSVTRSNNISLFKGDNLIMFEVTDPSLDYIRRNMEMLAIDVNWRFAP